jgi:intracellular sulfur oxidation DsrE/DsrF family protein
MAMLAPRLIALLAALWMLGISPSVFADGQYIDIAPKSQTEVQLVLDTLDASITNNATDLPPIVMMLHGDEAHRFLRGNYEDNKALVDQTAKLAAYQVIQVQICATWMRMNGYQQSDLFPFVTSVPLGVAELERLATEEGYSEYTVDL